MDEKIQQRDLERARWLVQTLRNYLANQDFSETEAGIKLNHPVNFGGLAQFDKDLLVKQGYAEHHGVVCRRLFVQATSNKIALYHSGLHAFCAVAITFTEDGKLLQTYTMVTPGGFEIAPNATVTFLKVEDEPYYQEVNLLSTFDQGGANRDDSLEFVVQALQMAGLLIPEEQSSVS